MASITPGLQSSDSLLELVWDRRGRRAYVAWLEARAANDGGGIDKEAMKVLRCGWCQRGPTSITGFRLE